MNVFAVKGNTAFTSSEGECLALPKSTQIQIENSDTNIIYLVVTVPDVYMSKEDAKHCRLARPGDKIIIPKEPSYRKNCG